MTTRVRNALPIITAVCAFVALMALSIALALTTPY
jgi:hypothetical protein